VNQLKHALRQLILRPGLSVTVIVMLALGIGATTAIFSLFHQVLVESLPVPESDRLVELTVPGLRPGGSRASLAVTDFNGLFSYPMFRDLEERQNVLTGLAGHYDFLASLTSGTETIGGRGVLVSGRYFDVLNLRPALGRLITPEDEPRMGESNVVVLSHDYWQSRLGGDRNVLGDTLTVNNQPLTIIGVAPEGFSGTMPGWQPEVFVPLTLRYLMQPEEQPGSEEARLYYWVFVFGRLRPGVTIEQATGDINRLYGGIVAELEAPQVAGQLTAEQMQQFLEGGVVLEPGGRGQNADRVTASNPLTLLLGATVLVLLIVCVNVTNLLLARGAARASEIAIRASIGADRRDLLALLLAESGTLAVLGGLLALPIAAVTLRIIAAMVPPALANRFAPELSVEALVFASAAVIVAVLLFGLLPAVRASDTDPGRVIKGEAGQPSGGRGLARFRSALIGVQIMLSTVLLVLAGLFTQSLANVARLNLGMSTESVVRFSVSPLLSGYASERLEALYDRIAVGLEAQPGVLSVGSSALPLLGNFAFRARVNSVGGTNIQGDDRFVQAQPFISPRFFETLSVPLLAGREFTDADRASGAGVVIVNQAFLRRFNLDMDAVGERLEANVAYYPQSSVEIIGVVGDARYAQVKGDVPAQVYAPRPLRDNSFSSLFFYVRGGGEAEMLRAMIPSIIRNIDPGLPISNLDTLEQLVANSVYLDRLIATLSATFAGLATLLAGVGLYAVLSYSIGQRTRELGLRLALGASPASLRFMVLKHVGRIAAIAAAIGLGVALGLGRLAESLLYDLSGFDPIALGGAALVITIVVLGAAYAPARRASRVAPMEALRYE
jgi:predicted permease